MSSAFIPAARPIVGDEEREAVDRVLRSGMIAQGPEVAAFEQEFGAHFAGGRPTVAVNSGTAGQHPGRVAAGGGARGGGVVASFSLPAARDPRPGGTTAAGRDAHPLSPSEPPSSRLPICCIMGVRHARLS